MINTRNDIKGTYIDIFKQLEKDNNYEIEFETFHEVEIMAVHVFVFDRKENKVDFYIYPTEDTTTSIIEKAKEAIKKVRFCND